MTKRPMIDENHPVTIAVEPQRAASMDRVEQCAREQVAKLAINLEAAGFDANKLAPYPNSLRCSRIQYKMQQADYYFVRRLTRSTSKGYSRSPGDPEPREMDQEAIAKYIADCRENASLQYDMFIVKMVGKIGACDAAALTGSHVWGYSFLTVYKGDAREVWKTQQITNVSCLGTVFNQWPSRKQK